MDVDALIRGNGGRVPKVSRRIEFYPTLFSEIILRNPDLQLEVASPGGQVGSARVVLAQVYGRPSVLVDVTDVATHDLGRDALTEGLKWRDRMNEAHGPWVESGPNALIAAILKHGPGLDDSDVAERLNQAMAIRLREAAELRKGGRLLASQMLLNYVREVLAVFESYKEADTDIVAALDRAESGKEPFLPDSPITGQMVNNLLRSKRAIAIKQRTRLLSAGR